MTYDVQITILKKLQATDVCQEYAKNPQLDCCPKGEVGQMYVSTDGQMPAGFCPGAWEGLAGKAAFLAEGKDSPYVRQTGVAIHCCNDGLHPVIFKLERIVEA